jgi:hypothetical protein
MIGRGAAPAARIRRRARLASACLLVIGGVVSGSPTDLPRSAIAVERDGAWHEWWQSARAPVQWREPSEALIDAIAWREAAPGVEWGEVRLAGTGEAWRVRVIIARIEPGQVRFAFTPEASASGAAASWSVARAPDSAVLAVNAGQFASGRPWGWVVREGREVQPPGTGPLAPAVVVDRAGAVHVVLPDSIAAWRASGDVVTALQSYPALLLGDGEVPFPLRAAGYGVNVHHRDARLAIGTTREGRVLLALTRFEGLRGTLSVLPFGFTTPEMAAIMGALGASRAVLLDGGISGQMRIRGADGAVHEWDALRKVPLGLLVAAR